MTRLTDRPAIAALAGALTIAFSAIIVRLSHATPSTAAVFRCVYALPLLALLARRESRLYGPRTRADLRLTAVAGLFFAIDLIVWARAIEDVGAGLATVLGNLQVVLVGVLAWAFLRERPERRMFVATPIVLVGVILISGVVGSGTYGRDPARGVVYGLLTAIAYAGFILCLRHGNNDLRRPAGPLFEATATAAVFALVLGAALGDLHVVPSWPEHGWLLLLALSSQVMGWLLISISLPRLPAAVTSVTLDDSARRVGAAGGADLQRVAVRVPVHRRGGGACRRAGGELPAASCRCHIFRGQPMTVSGGNGGRSRNLILAAMIFAVAMTFIDQTIVSIAAPKIQKRARSDQHRRAVGDQRLPAVAGRAVRLRRPAGRHGRATGRWSRSA